MFMAGNFTTIKKILEYVIFARRLYLGQKFLILIKKEKQRKKDYIQHRIFKFYVITKKWRDPKHRD